MGVVGCTCKTCYVAAQWQGRRLVEAEMAAPLALRAANGSELPRMACGAAYTINIKRAGVPATRASRGQAV